MATAQKRITYFDWLRGAATYAVVMLHMCNKILTDYPAETLGRPLIISWTMLQLVFTRWAVPSFLMITGALLLDPKRTTDWGKIARYVRRMVCVLLIFCPIYTCMSARAITPSAILEGIGKAFTRGSWDHLWYLYDLIGLYLLTPLLAGYVRASSRSQQRITLAVLAVITLVIPTINNATGAGITRLAWVNSSVFYYLLGSYAHQFLRLDDRVTVLGIGALALCALSAILFVNLRGTYPKWLIIPESPLIAAWSLLIFVAAHTYLDGRPTPRALSFASTHSLAIYLVHPLPLIVLYRRLWWVPYETLPPVLFELAVLAIVFAITLPIAALLKRVPKLGSLL